MCAMDDEKMKIGVVGTAALLSVAGFFNGWTEAKQPKAELAQLSALSCSQDAQIEFFKKHPDLRCDLMLNDKYPGVLSWVSH